MTSKTEQTISGSTSTSTSVGRRSYQEDRYVYEELAFGYLLAVFDGHSGATVADMASKNLSEIFSTEFKQWQAIGTDNYETLLRSVTATLDELVKAEKSGSTMSLVFIPKKSGVSSAWVAVIGDSPVVITDASGKIFIGPEHNVRTNLIERRAAEVRGGFYSGGYIWNPDTEQGLQMGRDLGNRINFGSILSHEPDVMEVKLGEDSIILITSDGVFDPSHTEDTLAEAGRFIDMVRKGNEAKDLVNDALSRQTGDNATAIVWRAKK